MWIICDKNNVVQDISTEEANLSRGYAYIGHKKYEIDDSLDVVIQDKYSEKGLVKNKIERDKKLKESERRTKIDKEKDTILEEMAIERLKNKKEI